MTNVVPFTLKANAGGGWTAAERSRLAELAERLSAGGHKVEAVYGVSDEGDPWCVIKDENEEVLVHVARIDGQFVIHDAAADAIQEGDSLWSACDRLLGEAWRDPREDVVVPLSHRQAQSVIALALAVAFIHEVQEAEAAVAEEAAPPPAEAAAMMTVAATAIAAAVAGEEPRHEILVTRSAIAEAAGSSASPESPPAQDDNGDVPEHSAAAPDDEADLSALTVAPIVAAKVEEAPDGLRGTEGADTLQGGDGGDVIYGGAGDDSLNGGGGADVLHGGSGADTLDGGGADAFQFDLLDGGAGDDVINLGGDVVARGGEGADSFVINDRPAADGSGLLGVIVDFREDQGDRLVLPSGTPARPIGESPVTNLTSGPGGGGFDSTTTGGTQGFNGRQVFVDMDGDGVADGHVLLVASNEPPATVYSLWLGFGQEIPEGYTLLA